MALGKVGFAGTVYGECYSPSVILGEQIAECFLSFAECFGHSANSRSPVVTEIRNTHNGRKYMFKQQPHFAMHLVRKC